MRDEAAEVACANVAALVDAAAARRPDRTALVVAARGGGVERVAFGDLARRAGEIAGALAGAGIAAGDRVVVAVTPSVEAFAALVAVARVGAVVVVPPPGSLLDSSRRLGGLRPRAVLGSRRAVLAARALPGLRRVPLWVSLPRRGRDGPAGEVASVPPDQPALITWTRGGTSGAGPRPVVRSHRVLAEQHRELRAALPVVPDDVDLTVFPVVALHDVAGGITAVIPALGPGSPATSSIRELLGLAEAEGATTASAPPEVWAAVAALCAAEGRHVPWRRVVVGGAPLSPSVVAGLCAAAPRAEVVAVYGSTEAEPVAILHAAPPGGPPGAWSDAVGRGSGAPLGRPVASVRTAIVDAAGHTVVVGDGPANGREAPSAGSEGRARQEGAVGRLVVAGPQVAGAGTYDTGDIVRRDAAGDLWLLGRAGAEALLGIAGTYPVQVELAVGELPWVRRAAVLRVPGIRPSRDGGPLVLAIEARAAPPGRWEDEARAAWRAVVSDSLPDELRLVPALPTDRRHGARVDVDALARALGPARSRVWWAYMRERFPPATYAALVAAFFGANHAVGAAAAGAVVAPAALRFLAGAVVLWLGFFHLRVIDEHKDYGRDVAVHPTRLLARGLITRHDLRLAGAAAVAAEIAIAAALGRAPFAAWLAVLGLSALAARDFLAASAFERRPLAGALVHMSIVPAQALFAFSVATGLAPWAAPPAALACAAAGYAAGLGLEVARKVRAPEEERSGLLTYSSALGVAPAAVAAGASFVAAAVLAGAAAAALELHAGVVVVLAVCAAAGVVAAAAYARRPSRGSADRLYAAAAGFVLVAYAALAWAAWSAGGTR